MLRLPLALVGLVATLPAHALPLHLSTTSSATLGDTRFRSGEIAAYDPVVDSATVAWVETFMGSENINALHDLGNSRFVLSTSTDGEMESGLTFRDGDLLLVNAMSGAVSHYFSEDAFGGADEDIDALYLFDDGRLALSTTSSVTLGGLSWGSDDIGLYDPVADLATLLFDGGATFDDRENVDALHLLDDGALLLSSSTDFAIGGVSYLDGDVIRLDLLTGSHSLYLAESLFDADEDIDAFTLAGEPLPLPLGTVAIALPGTLLMLVTGLPGLRTSQARS